MAGQRRWKKLHAIHGAAAQNERGERAEQENDSLHVEKTPFTVISGLLPSR
jgi:hypothetical protein